MCRTLVSCATTRHCVANIVSGAQLACGRHTCDRRCHKIEDHSKIICQKRVEKTCDRGHKFKVPCGSVADACRTCAKEDAETRRRVQRDLDLERMRQEHQDNYTRELQKLEDEIDHQRRMMRYEVEEKEREDDLRQKKEQLQTLKETKARMDQAKAKQELLASRHAESKNGMPKGDSVPDANEFDAGPSNARDEWQSMKEQRGDKNVALDQLMGLIGLESVKDEFLSTKSSVDTKIRQGVSLAEERFSCSLLGNPGTGVYGITFSGT